MPSSIEVRGIFKCKVCGQNVDYATYNADTSIINWVCSTTHISEVNLFVRRGY
jgi:hypothetical protein